MTGAEDHVWYAAFGSNLNPARLGRYLAGGRPPGASRDYEGCRDPAPPTRTRAVDLPGELRFGGVSRVWGGGMAFYVPGETGVVHARAYLLRAEQFGDIVSQETRHPVGRALVLAVSGPTRHGLSEVYDVVLDLGLLDGHRVVTLTSSREHRPNPASAAYLRTMIEGLAEGFGLDEDARIAYLAAAGGMAPVWTAARIRQLSRT